MFRWSQLHASAAFVATFCVTQQSFVLCTSLPLSVLGAELAVLDDYHEALANLGHLATIIFIFLPLEP